jgi:predicted nucleic acid-binding protein
LPGFLVDTNVLLYALEPSPAGKPERARACIVRLGSARNGALSAQILSEFFVVATRKVQPPLTFAEAERLVSGLGRSWPVYDITSMAVLETIRAVQQHQFAYWDALVWATAKLHGIPNVLTEDRPSSGLVEGVRFIDPFDPSFELTRLD